MTVRSERRRSWAAYITNIGWNSAQREAVAGFRGGHLVDLTEKGALVRRGELRHARYNLSVPLKSVPRLTVSEDGQLVEG